MYKICIYGCAMFKKLVCQWVNQIDVAQLVGSCECGNEPSGSTKCGEIPEHL